ncbi:MAG TPA: M28 family peptidase, partial [Thermoanaerobaculia bacterium]|nr:M28 family peptidase [Thermoanaerobaculia bacterium]
MRRALSVFLPLLAVLALATWRARGPEPKPATAPPREFSAARAMDVLRATLAEQTPHPVASPANARVRDRIVARFRDLGYPANVHRTFACNAHAVCANVDNILAGAPNAAVLLVAHYDSVGAGPGASDDGMGIATLLEIARAIRGERFHNSVAFLVDDGEEAGLLGAEGFVAQGGAPRIVINVENRGTYGLSNMFETSRGNRWLVRHLARALERPQGSSLFYAIYNLL